jgi:CHAD domain-containing protein
MKSSQEIEAKFDLDPATTLPSFTGSAGDTEVVVLPPVELTARYFDTPGLRLLRHGATLRQRRSADPSGENLWTLKLPSGGPAAAYSRKELSWPGASEQLPAEALDLVAGMSLRESLVEVAVLESSRKRVELRCGGRCLAEIDDDTVTVHRPSRQVFRQVEVELREADGDLLGNLTDELIRVGAVRGADQPKLVRALGLDPQHDPQLGPSATMAAVISKFLASGLEQLLANDPGVRLDDDPEFVHKARVATRRLRSELASFKPFLDSAWVDRVRSELRWLGAALGQVRDDDVLGDRLRALQAEAAARGEVGYDELLTRLASQRSAAVAYLRIVLGSDRYFALLQGIEDAARRPPIAEGTDPLAPASRRCARMLRREWKRARREVGSLGDNPLPSDLHRVRIKAKRVRYAAEASQDVLGGPAVHLAREAERLQNILGEHQDAVAMEAWARAAGEHLSAAGSVAAGEVVDREQRSQARARRKWHKSWKRLQRAARRVSIRGARKRESLSR